MERMLHRGPYATGDTHGTPAAKRRFTWGSLIGFDSEFTRGDKWISGSMFAWNMFWLGVFGVVSVWNIFQRWPVSWWSRYWQVCSIGMPLAVGVVTTVWFTWGGVLDLRKMFAALRAVRPDARDDGMVVDHHNRDDPDSVAQAQAVAPPTSPAESREPRAGATAPAVQHGSTA
jgi:SSS family solute:Na+ symporter